MTPTVVALIVLSPLMFLSVVTLGIWVNMRVARLLGDRDPVDAFQERVFVGYRPTLTVRVWGVCLEGYWQAVAFVLQWTHAVRAFPNPPLDPSGGKLVVLVPGYGENGGILWLLARRLRARGHQAIVLDWRSTLWRLEDNALFLHDAISQLLEGAGAKRAVLIGHSMGGVVGRTYVHMRDDHHLAAVISLCSPHRGTHIGRFGPGPSARDMTPGSAHMKEYPPSRIARVPIHTLISGADNIVAPPWSTVLMEGDNVLLSESVGHVGPLYLETVAAQVAAWVDAALVTPPAATPPTEAHPPLD